VGTAEINEEEVKDGSKRTAFPSDSRAEIMDNGKESAMRIRDIEVIQGNCEENQQSDS
jgi:hypothetical protein